MAPLADQPTAQIELARAEAKLSSARLLLRESVAEDSDDLPANLGIFLTLDRRIYLGAGGFHLFSRAAITRAGLGQASAYLAGGLTYHGLFTSRSDGTMGVGLSNVWLEHPQGLCAETFVERFYKARFTKFLSLQPDLQLFRRPRGGPDHAWTFTLRGRAKL
jgi:carbohydrate-selective porin OprB